MIYKSSSTPQVDEVTYEVFIPGVIDREPCAKHHAEIGRACFYIPGMDGVTYWESVCNRRAVRAGINGPINPMSLLERPFAKKNFRG